MRSRRPHTVAWALGLSAVVHLLFFTGMALLAGLNAFAARIDPRLLAPVEEIVEVTLIAEPEVRPAPPPAKFIRTDESQRAARPPEKSRFHSDRDTRAAALLPPDPKGEVGAPSQEGIDVPVVEVVAQDLIDGESEDGSAAPIPLASAVANAPAPDAGEAAAPPPPAVDSPAVAEPGPAAPDHPPPANPDTVATTVDPAAAPIAIPDKPPADRPPDLREPEVESPPPAKPPEPAAIAKTPDRPPPRASTPPVERRFQAHSALTRARGTITNQGPSSVDAADTPVGQYMKQVTGAIEREWHRKRRVHADFVTYGTIRLEFNVTPSGKVHGLRISNRNGANAVMQDFTLSAVLDAKVPPMPAGLSQILDNERLHITYDIIVY